MAHTSQAMTSSQALSVDFMNETADSAQLGPNAAPSAFAYQPAPPAPPAHSGVPTALLSRALRPGAVRYTAFGGGLCRGSSGTLPGVSAGAPSLRLPGASASASAGAREPATSPSFVPVNNGFVGQDSRPLGFLAHWGDAAGSSLPTLCAAPAPSYMVPTPLRDCGAGASVEAVGGLAPSTDDAEPLRPASPARRTTEVAAAPASREDSFLIPSLPLHNRSQVDHDLLLPSPACAWAEGPCSLLHPVLPALPEPHLPPTSPHRPPLPATAPHTTTAPAPAPAVPSLSSGSSLDRGASAAPSSRGASAPLQGEPEVISAATLPCPMSYAYVATGPSAAVSGSTPAIPAAQAPAVKRLRLVGVPPQVAAPAPAIGASAGSAAVLEAPASAVAAAPAAAAGGARGKRRATAAAAAAAVAVMARGELSDEDTDEDYDAQEEAMGGAGRAPKRARKAPGAGGVRMPGKPPRTGVTCRNCGAKETPQWRCGPEGPRTLCNACGVRFKKGLPLAYMERKKREGRMGL